MSLCAVVHILGDSVTLSQHLLHLVSSLRNLSWSGCPAGELVASDRACYAAPAPLCSNVRSRLAESFRREQLDQGLPTSGGSDGALVVAVPARDYRHEAAGCIPGVYNPVHQAQPRRDGVPWDGGSFDEIRAQPLLSLAAVWVLVFALARHGLTSARRFFYAMVLLHLVTTALLLVRGAALPGGLGGLGMLFYADWGSVVDVELIVPDILLELLAASHPLVVANRTLVHFFLCALLVTASTVVCSPCVVCAEVAIIGYKEQGLHYPMWTYAVTTWLYLVQLSCIPVFAIVFMNETGLVLRRGPVKKSSSSSSSTEVLGSPDLFVASHTNPSPGSGNSRKGSLGSPRNQAGNPGPGVVPDSGTVHVSRRLSSIRRSMMRPKPPTVEYVSSEVTKSSRPAAASTETCGHEPADHRPHKKGSDRGTSLGKGPYPPNAAAPVDHAMDIASLPAAGHQSEPIGRGIREEKLQEKPPGKIQDVAVVVKGEQAKRQSKKTTRAQKAGSKSKLSTKSSVTDDVGVKRDMKVGAVSQGSGASAKVAGAQKKPLVGHKMRAEEDVPAKSHAEKAAACLQEEPKEALKRLKEEVMLRRKRRKHKKAASVPAAVSAEPHDVASAQRAASVGSDLACQPAVVRAPYLTSIDKTTAFRSLLRNLLLGPEERADALQRVRRVSSEAASKERIAAASPWFSLDTLRTAPPTGSVAQAATAATTASGGRLSVPEAKRAPFGGGVVSGVPRGSASLGPRQPTLAEQQEEDIKRPARRKSKADDVKRKVSVVGSVQEHERRKSSMPAMPGSPGLRKTGSQAELAPRASRAQSLGTDARETRPQSPIVVSTRSKHSERAGAAGNTAREMKKANKGQQDKKHMEVPKKPSRTET
ncbi:hypothetical protein V5799_012749 [Amblyomma americanum]|uniref:Uncharacterized protein n=1 Tax=Amblyomma americanum TaxID=6943 RepID=A0AAQ4E7W8_AMBAM